MPSLEIAPRGRSQRPRKHDPPGEPPA